MAFELAVVAAPLFASIAYMAFDSWLSPAFPIFALCGASFILLIRSAATFRLNIATSSLLAGFAFWYAYPALVTYFVPAAAMVELGAREHTAEGRALLSLSIFLFSILIGTHIGDAARLGTSLRAPRTPRTSAIFGTAVGACVVGLLPYLILGGGLSNVIEGVLGSRTADKTWANTSNLGDTQSAYITLATIALVSGNILLWLGALDSHLPSRRRRFGAFLAFFISAVIFFDSGTRSLLGLIILPPLAILSLRAATHSPKRALLLTLFGGTLVILLLQFQVLYRTVGPQHLSADYFEHWLTLNGNIDYFTETVFSAYLVPEQHPFFRESALLQFIAGPIPRFLWADKPIPELVRYYSWQRWGVDIYLEGGNVLPGVVGQDLMSWGMPGVAFTGIVMGLSACWINARIQRSRNDIYRNGTLLAAAVWLILSYRLMSPGFLYPVLGAGLIASAGRLISRPLASSNVW